MPLAVAFIEQLRPDLLLFVDQDRSRMGQATLIFDLQLPDDLAPLIAEQRKREFAFFVKLAQYRNFVVADSNDLNASLLD